MSSLPLHPAIVHLPVALALVLPLVAAGLWVALWKRWLPRKAWLVVAGLQALSVGGGLLALRTGEHEEERVEHRVPESALHQHERAAQTFVGASTALLALAAGLLLLRQDRAFLAGAGAAVLAAVPVAVLALHTGKAGGELVYVHNAGAAYAAAGEARPGGAPAEKPKHGEDDDD